MHTLNYQLKNLSTGPVSLGKELGKGGEGSVFTLNDASDLVVKIYHTSVTRDKSDKILDMVHLKNERLLKLSAWPIASYHEKDGRLSGFIMPRLNNYLPLYELYNPSLRLQKFSQADWRFLVHTAINVAKAFAVIHETGHVIGDVNHGNLLVAQDATVKFIDTDSFQIYTNAKYWLCEVGVPSYQPPEMQCSSFKDVIRTPNHDNFGLAVLIFHLLFLGRHPFSGRFQGKGEMPIEKAISEYRYAYSCNPQQTQMFPPPASLPIMGLSYHLQSLFERAFSKEASGDKVGLRPTPDMWITALADMTTKIKSCSFNGGHYYYKELNQCPWCDIEKLGGPVFPFRTNPQRQSNTTQSTQHNLQNHLDQTIRDINQDNLTIVHPKFIFNQTPPTIEAISLKKKLSFLKYFYFSSITTLLIGVFFITLMWVENWIVLGAQIAFSTLIGTSFAYKIYKKTLSKNFLKIIDEFRTEKSKLTKQANAQNYNSSIEEIKNRLNELNKLHLEISTKRSNLIKQRESKLYTERLQSTLHNSFINNANIEGIGPEWIKTLKLYGIETAFDIVDYRLQGIKGFGDVIRGRLVRWRQNIEYFTNSQPIKLTAQQIAEIDKDIENQRDSIATELADTLNKYISLTGQLKEHNKNIEIETAKLVKKYSQAFADAKVLGFKF